MCDSHLSADDAHEQASRMSALDLYEDLLIKEDGGDDGDRVLTMQEILSEKHSLEEKNAALLQRLSDTENLVKNLESKHLNLQKNFNNLLATAKVELDRKNSLLSHYAGGSTPVARATPNASHCTKEQDRSSRKKKGLLDMFKGRRLNEDELAAMKSSGPGTSTTPSSLPTLLQHRGEKMVGVATRVIGSSFENMASVNSVTSMNTPFNHQKTISHVSNNGGQSSNIMDESSEPPTQSSSSNIQQDTVDARTTRSRPPRPISCDLGQRSRSVARVASENIGPRTPSPPPVVRNSKNVSRAISTPRTSNSSEPQIARVASKNIGPRTPSPPPVVRNSKNLSRAPSINIPRTSNSSEPQIVSEPLSRSSATSSNSDTQFDANPTGSQYLSKLGVEQSKKTSMEIPGKNIPKNPDRVKNIVSHQFQTSASKTRLSNQSLQPSTRKSFVPIAGPVTGAFDGQRLVQSRENRSRTTSKEFIERPKSSAYNIAALKNGISNNESRKFSTRRSSQSETQPGSDRNPRPFENSKSRSLSNSEEITSIMQAWDNAVSKVKNTHRTPANAATPAVCDERARTPEAQLPRPTSRNSVSDRNIIADRVESRHSFKTRVDRSSSNTNERTDNAQKTSTVRDERARTPEAQLPRPTSRNSLSDRNIIADRVESHHSSKTRVERSRSNTKERTENVQKTSAKISDNRKFDNRTRTNRDESLQNRIRSKDRDNDRYYENSQRQRTSSDRRVDGASRSSSQHREKEHPRRNSGSRSSNRVVGGRGINEKSNQIEGQARPRDERRDSQSNLRRSKNVSDSNISQKNESRKSRDLREKPMRGDKPVKRSPRKSKSGAFISPKKNRKSLPERRPVETKATLAHTEKSNSKASSKTGVDSTLNKAMIGVKTNGQFLEIDGAMLKNKPIIPPKSKSRERRPRIPKKLPRTPPQKSTTGVTKQKTEGTETSGGKKPCVLEKSHFSVKAKEKGGASSAATTNKSPRRATPKKKKTPKKVLQDNHSKFNSFSNISGDGVSSIVREKTFPCPPSPARSDSRETFGYAQSPAELELDYDEDSLMYREIMQPDAVSDKNPIADKTPSEMPLDKTRTEISGEAQAEETRTKTAKSPRATSEKFPLLKKTDSTLLGMVKLQSPKKGTLDSVESIARPSTERDIAGVLLALASSPKYQPRVHLFNISKSPLSKGIKRKTSFETLSVSPSIKKTKTMQNDKQSKSSPKRKPNLPKILPSETTFEIAKTNDKNIVTASEPENDRKNPKKDLRIPEARVSPPGTPVNTSLIDVAMEVEVETSPKFHTKSKEKLRKKKSKRKKLKVKLKIQKKGKSKKINDKKTTAETKKVSKVSSIASSFSSTLNSSDFFPDLSSSSSSSSETAPIRTIREAPPALSQWLDSAKKNKTKKKLKTVRTQKEIYTDESLQRKVDDADTAAEIERDRIETKNAVASICEDMDEFSVDATHLESQSVVTQQNNGVKNPMRFYCNAALKFLFHLAAEKLKPLRETSEKPLDLSLKKRPQPADTVKTATKEQHPTAVVNLFPGAKAPNTTKTSHCSQPAKTAPVPKSRQNGTTTNPTTSGGCSKALEGENFDKLLQQHTEEQKNLKRKDESDKRQQPPPKKKPRRVALERVEMPEPRRKEIVSPPLSRSLWMTSLVKCQQRRKVRSRWSSEVSESEEQPQCSSETLATNNNEVTEKETSSAKTNGATSSKLRIKPVLPNSVLGLKRKNLTSKANKPSESSFIQDSNETTSSSSSRFSVGELLPDMSSSSWQLSEESRCRLQSFAKAVNFLSPIKSSPKTQKTTPQKVNSSKADVKRRVLQSP